MTTRERQPREESSKSTIKRLDAQIETIDQALSDAAQRLTRLRHERGQNSSILQREEIDRRIEAIENECTCSLTERAQLVRARRRQGNQHLPPAPGHSREITTDLIDALGDVDFSKQREHFWKLMRESTRQPPNECLLIISSDEEARTWLTKRLIAEIESAGDFKIIRTVCYSKSSTSIDSLWADLYEKLVPRAPRDRGNLSSIFAKVPAKQSLIFVVQKIEQLTQELFHEIFEDFWVPVVEAWQTAHAKSGMSRRPERNDQKASVRLHGGLYLFLSSATANAEAWLSALSKANDHPASRTRVLSVEAFSVGHIYTWLNDARVARRLPATARDIDHVATAIHNNANGAAGEILNGLCDLLKIEREKAKLRWFHLY